MRKLTSVLLPVAAVGVLVGSTLAVAGPAAADPQGHGYGRPVHHAHVDRAHGRPHAAHRYGGHRGR